MKYMGSKSRHVSIECRTCKVYLYGSHSAIEGHEFHDLWTIGRSPEKVQTREKEQWQREMDMWRKAGRYDDLTRDLTKAINNEGRNPAYHRETMARHRKEWPTLWKIIDEALEYYKRNAGR